MDDRFRVLDAARAVVDEINDLLDRSKGRLLYQDQLRESAGSITANIREALGRRKGPERNQFFRYAKGSAEEVDEQLWGNWKSNRIKASTYWRLHNRLVTIRKMLESLMD